MLVFVSRSSECITVIFTTQQHKVIQSVHILVYFMDGRILSLSHSHYTICNVLYQYNTQNQCIFTTQIKSFLLYNKGNSKITKLRTILQTESQNS